MSIFSNSHLSFGLLKFTAEYPVMGGRLVSWLPGANQSMYFFKNLNVLLRVSFVEQVSKPLQGFFVVAFAK